MPKLPKKDEITFRWLVDHIPVSWWAIAMAAIASVFTAGIGLGRISFKTLDGDIRQKISVRDELRSEVEALTSRKAVLEAAIIRLQTEKRVQEMSDEQVREEINQKWTRD